MSANLDIDSLVAGLHEAKQSGEGKENVVEAAPSGIIFLTKLELKRGMICQIQNLVTNLPSAENPLKIKLPGNCTYFDYRPDRSVIITDYEQNVRFKIGDNGLEHIVVIPAGVMGDNIGNEPV